MAFSYDKQLVMADLKHHFPNTEFHQVVDIIQQNALFIFAHD